MSRAERVAQYRGDLRQTALPEMLAIIDRTRVSGVIEAVHGDWTKRIHLENGYVVHASSSDLADSLGTFLRRSGKLTEEQFDTAMRRRAGGTSRLGEVLIEHRLLAPDEVFQAIREHVEGILWSLFSWEEGVVTFSLGEGELENYIRTQVPLRQVILRGIKRAGNPKSIVQRMGGRETLLEPSFRLEELIEVGLDHEEYDLLTRVDGRKTLYELCVGGPLTAADAARVLYAFSVLGLVRKMAGSGTTAGGSGGIRIKLRSEG